MRIEVDKMYRTRSGKLVMIVGSDSDWVIKVFFDQQANAYYEDGTIAKKGMSQDDRLVAKI